MRNIVEEHLAGRIINAASVGDRPAFQPDSDLLKSAKSTTWNYAKDHQ